MVKHLGISRVILLIALLAVFAFPQKDRKFRWDDPLWRDSDQTPIPKPRPLEVSQIFDFLENTFTHRPDKKEKVPPAENVNTLGEVPDSSWFTNRMGRQRMTLRELVRGPDQVEGPDRSRPWLVAGVKSEGITPGFIIRDARDEIYFVKFDPPGHPQLSTSAEVIATKFFHAFGYHVPENYLVFIRRRDVIVASDRGHCGRSCEIKGHQHPRAVFVDEEGKERPVTEADIDKIFKRVFRGTDGRTPVVASRRLPGSPVGPFKYFGTRGDDPNDIFPHQNRRELRGLRVFSAWLNHDDSRSINSLDMYVGETGQGYVRHHLIDFGSCFGSGSIKVQSRRAGNEYIFEGDPTLKAGVSLGLWDRRWRHVKYPKYASIGRFEGDFFQPHLWKPEYPNPAFERMKDEDAFWATRIVMRFSNEMIRAIVGNGQLVDTEAENYLVETLIKRRDKIVRYYLSRMNPLDGFRLTGKRGSLKLEFDNLGIEAGLTSSSSYNYQWFSFDNKARAQQQLSQPQTSTLHAVPVPQTESDYLSLHLGAVSPGQPNWNKRVSVFIRNDRLRPVVVGVDREL